MLTRLPVALALLLALPPAAHPESCADRIREAATTHQARNTVSAATLRIPAKAWQHFEKARAAHESGKLDVFDRESARALEAAPRFAEVYLLRAAHELRAGRAQSALDQIAAARAIDPNLAWSGVIAAGALNQLHRFHDAISELDRIRGEEADSWQARYERARAETGRQNVEAALRWSDLAVAAAPVGCTDARLVRANALQLTGRATEVIHELETYLALDRQGTRRTQVLTVLERVRGAGAPPDSGLVAMK